SVLQFAVACPAARGNRRHIAMSRAHSRPNAGRAEGVCRYLYIRMDRPRRLLAVLTLRRNRLRGEIVMQREKRELEAIGDAELVEDVREVVFDRLLADRHLCRDVAVGIAAENHADDLELPRREAELFSARPRMRRRQVA